MMARMLRSPTPQECIYWYMNTPYAMTWFGVGGGMRGLAKFEPHCPMLYLYGTRKPFMFHSQQWLDTLNERPGSKAVGLQTGHWVMVAQREAFEAQVLEWLDAV